MSRSNARQYPRAPLTAIVHCTTPTGDQILASGGNISCGGLFVPTAQDVEVGTPLSVRFRLPYPGRTLTREAKVVWRRAPQETGGPAGVGLAFTGSAEGAVEVISQYVASIPGAS